jgi:hypothetical protein
MGPVTAVPGGAERLNQGPFPDWRIPDARVVMATTPSDTVIDNVGMGLITYLCDEAGPPRMDGETVENLLEELARIPLGNKLYVRLNWKDIQRRPGRLDPCPHWTTAFELARRYSKRIGFRVMLSNPNIPDLAVPGFVAEKIPWVRMGERFGKTQYEPRYDHPVFQAAFRELNGLLAAEYNGHPLVEFVDTFMYGFWGEGHTCGMKDPLETNPFPDLDTGSRTFSAMLEEQLAAWTRTPLATNTQPDCSRVGNAAVLGSSIENGQWLRTDSIFIENEQVETLSNRPPWIAAVCEAGMSDGSPESLHVDDGITYTDNVISHVMDLGANYWSLWNWQAIRHDRIQAYYDRFPHGINDIARSVGYRVRPSWIWECTLEEHPAVIVGLANDGISGVPGVLHLSLTDATGTRIGHGCLDAGHPVPGRIRQALFMLPKGTSWQGLRLSAAIEVKGTTHPVAWACRQPVNDDGSLTLRKTAAP